MNELDKAVASHLANLQARSGKTLDQLGKLIRASGLTRHGEIRDLLKRDLAMGHGDANAMAHHFLKSRQPANAGGAAPQIDEIVAGYYSGAKAALRPIHDLLMTKISKFGPFEIAPKKTYLSLRRKKQFAMVGPATNTRVEVGLNLKGVAATSRLVAMPPKGMCDFKVKLESAGEVDAALLGWIKYAYDGAA